jgi:uncharacterized protein (TIGR03067 family)
MKLRLLVILAIPLCAPALSRADDKEDFTKGTWKVTSIESEGRALPPDTVKEVDMKFTFAPNGNLVETASAGVKKEGNYSIDFSKKPKEINLSLAGKEAKGIYELTGDTLKICIGETDRPTEFATKKDVKSALFTLQREK